MCVCGDRKNAVLGKLPLAKVRYKWAWRYSHSYFEASRDLSSCLEQSTAEPGINHLALAANFCILAIESLLCLAIVCATLPPYHVIKRQGHMSILRKQ